MLVQGHPSHLLVLDVGRERKTQDWSEEHDSDPRCRWAPRHHDGDPAPADRHVRGHVFRILFRRLRADRDAAKGKDAQTDLGLRRGIAGGYGIGRHHSRGHSDHDCSLLQTKARPR